MNYPYEKAVFGSQLDEERARRTALTVNQMRDAADLYTADKTGTVPTPRPTYQPRMAGGIGSYASQIAATSKALQGAIGSVRNLLGSPSEPAYSPQPSSYEIPSWEQSFSAPSVVPNISSVAAAPTSFAPAAASTQVPWVFPSSLPGGF